MKRVLGTMGHIGWKSEWVELILVIFSDENKFNLDTLDGVKHYWHDLRRSQKCFSSLHCDGRSIIIWAPSAENFEKDLAFIEITMDSKRYKTDLE